jgi:hypothetical protein
MTCAHVTWVSVQADADLSFREEHQLRTKCSSTPPPGSSRTSKRPWLESIAPKSMNSPVTLPARALVDIGAAARLPDGSCRSRTRQPSRLVAFS